MYWVWVWVCVVRNIKTSEQTLTVGRMIKSTADDTYCKVYMYCTSAAHNIYYIISYFRFTYITIDKIEFYYGNENRFKDLRLTN